MALKAIRIEVFATKLPLVSNQMCADALMDKSMIIAFDHCRTKRHTALRGCTHRNTGHRLNATCDHNVVCSADHPLSRKMDGLLTRSTLTIDCGARYTFGETSGENGIAGHIQTLIPYLANTTYNYILHKPSANASALHQG